MVAAAPNDGLLLFVYALCEPDGKTIRYIGLSANLWKRLHNHYHHATMPNVRAWVFGLRERGLMPCMIVLREVRGMENGLEAEREEIAKFQVLLGDQLLNERDTGKRRSYSGYGRRISFNGRVMTKAQWARELGISRQALDLRLQSHPVETALSRGKLGSTPLTDKRLAPIGPVSQEDIAAALPQIDPDRFGVLECELLKKGLNHQQRRDRRKKIASMVRAGYLVGQVAEFFGITDTSVRQSIQEFEPQFAALAGT